MPVGCPSPGGVCSPSSELWKGGGAVNCRRRGAGAASWGGGRAFAPSRGPPLSSSLLSPPPGSWTTCPICVCPITSPSPSPRSSSASVCWTPRTATFSSRPSELAALSPTRGSVFPGHPLPGSPAALELGRWPASGWNGLPALHRHPEPAVCPAQCLARCGGGQGHRGEGAKAPAFPKLMVCLGS